MSDSKTPNIIKKNDFIENEWRFQVETAEFIYNEIEQYKTNVINNIDKKFAKMYRIRWWIVIPVLMFPIFLFLITTRMTLRFFFPIILISTALFLIILIITFFYSGYTEIKCRIATKNQTALLVYKIESILPLGIGKEKYNRNMLSDPNADYEIDIEKLKKARDKIINMDLSEIYKEAYINYSFIDYIKGLNQTKNKED